MAGDQQAEGENAVCFAVQVCFMVLRKGGAAKQNSRFHGRGVTSSYGGGARCSRAASDAAEYASRSSVSSRGRANQTSTAEHHRAEIEVARGSPPSEVSHGGPRDVRTRSKLRAPATESRPRTPSGIRNSPISGGSHCASRVTAAPLMLLVRRSANQTIEESRSSRSRIARRARRRSASAREESPSMAASVADSERDRRDGRWHSRRVSGR